MIEDPVLNKSVQRGQKLAGVAACLRAQLEILDEEGCHLAAARLAQALDIIQADAVALDPAP